jgi:hypothetical protein
VPRAPCHVSEGLADGVVDQLPVVVNGDLRQAILLLLRQKLAVRRLVPAVGAPQNEVLKGRLVILVVDAEDLIDTLKTSSPSSSLPS